MKVVDSSVWVSLFSHDDMHHDKAKAWFSSLASSEVLSIPALALVEVAAVLGRAGKKSASIDHAVAYMRNWAKVWYMDEANTSICVEVAKECKVRGADAVFLAAAQQLNAVLVTLDTEQIKRSGKIQTENLGE